MHQRELVAQPRKQSTKKRLRPCEISYCPKCRRLKSPTAKLCIECHANRPPEISHIFIVEGERCRKMPLTQGQYTLVDADRYDDLMRRKWYARWDSRGKRFYAMTAYKDRNGVFRKKHLHRIILSIQGEALTDHINRDSLDNRRSNLRKCTPHQNQANTKIRSDNTTGYRGVKYRDYDRKRWSAVIQVKNKEIFLGNFLTAEEAARAYDEGAFKYLGEFATLNFPRQRARP